MTINQYMAHEHRRCDEEFVNAENAIDQGKSDAKALFAKFVESTTRHFRQEEEVMFKAYNERTGGGMNPTVVMMGEHEQMRAIMTQILENIESGNKVRAIGLCENLMFVMQQHNMKEEQMMYNLADRVLDAKVIIEAMVEVA